MYCSNHNNEFPSGTWPNPNLPPERRLSWYAAILPHLDCQGLYDALDKTQPWDAQVNQIAARARISELRCPDFAAAYTGTPAPTPFIGIAGVGTDAPSLSKSDPRAGVYGYDRQTTIADIKDGAANTMLIAESGRAKGPWLQGATATIRGLDPANQPYVGQGCQFGGLHADGRANVAFADGSVRVVTKTVAPELFEALSTIAGGEEAPLPDEW